MFKCMHEPYVRALVVFILLHTYVSMHIAFRCLLQRCSCQVAAPCAGMSIAREGTLLAKFIQEPRAASNCKAAAKPIERALN